MRKTNGKLEFMNLVKIHFKVFLKKKPMKKKIKTKMEIIRWIMTKKTQRISMKTG